MAKKKSKDDDTSNKVLWIAGAASVTAFAMFYVNRHLNEKEELTRLRYEGRREISDKSEGAED